MPRIINTKQATQAQSGHAMKSTQLSERFVLALAPGVGAAISFGISDAVAKIVMESGCSVTTLLLFRSVISLAFVAAWLQFRPTARQSSEVRWISIGIGIFVRGLDLPALQGNRGKRRRHGDLELFRLSAPDRIRRGITGS
jgi:hypothetical protein